MKEKTFEDLLFLMKYQAKIFLEESGEFFPYASVLTNQSVLETVGIVNTEDVDFDAIKAIEIFENKIAQQIKNGEVFIGAIGIDVIISGTKEDALMIKASDDGIKWHERNYPYHFVDGKVIITEVTP